MLARVGYEGKVCTITVDNAAYNDSVMRLLKDTLSFHKTLHLKGKSFYVQSCAHILNLLVQDGLSEIQDIIENIRESVEYISAYVKHISASTQRLIMFADIAKQLQLPNKKLILDCTTRCNATYAILSTALEFKQVFPRFSQRDSSYKHMPSEDDGVRVEEVCSVLELFNEIKNIISRSEYPTSSLFLLELWSIKELLDAKSQSEDWWLQAMAKKMQLKFYKYWSECNLLISLVIVLDPRNKTKLIDFALHVIYPEDEAPKHINLVCDSLYELYGEYLDEHKVVTSNAR